MVEVSKELNTLGFSDMEVADVAWYCNVLSLQKYREGRFMAVEVGSRGISLL